MTIATALRDGTLQLQQAGITDAKASARYLLAAVFGIPVNQLAVHLTDRLTADQFTTYQAFLNRRAQHEPVWHIVEQQSLAGLNLTATPATLIPRPETEQLIELVIQELNHQPTSSLIDVGTGSGLIALALALRLKDTETIIMATDISPEALAVARKNAAANHLTDRVDFYQADLLQVQPTGQLLSAEIIVANLPYIPSARIADLAPEVKDYEPRLALDGGPDGLDCYRQLFQQIQQLPQPPRALFLEIDESHGQSLPALVRSIWPAANPEIQQDLASLDRFAVIRNLA